MSSQWASWMGGIFWRMGGEEVGVATTPTPRDEMESEEGRKGEESKIKDEL